MASDIKSDQIVVFEYMLEDSSFNGCKLSFTFTDSPERVEILARLLAFESVDLEVAKDHCGDVTDEHEVLLFQLDLR